MYTCEVGGERVTWADVEVCCNVFHAASTALADIRGDPAKAPPLTLTNLPLPD